MHFLNYHSLKRAKCSNKYSFCQKPLSFQTVYEENEYPMPLINYS